MARGGIADLQRSIEATAAAGDGKPVYVSAALVAKLLAIATKADAA